MADKRDPRSMTNESPETDDMTIRVRPDQDGSVVEGDATRGLARETETAPARPAPTPSQRLMSWFPPRLVILLGTIAFALSHMWEWWHLKLNAPQYPLGLFVTVFTHKMIGKDDPMHKHDVREIDGLNHYIGMMSMNDAAKFERSIAVPVSILFIIMALVAVFLRKKWAPLLAIPIILFPAVFVADMYYWLWYAGNHLDKTAALKLPPFTPTMFGVGKIAQFSTEAGMGLGFWVAVAGAVLTLLGIIWSMMKAPRNT